MFFLFLKKKNVLKPSITKLLLITILKKIFCRANCFNFFSSQNSFFVNHISSNFFSSHISFFVKHVKFERRKELKKELSEKLMPVVWHPNRWWVWNVSEDEKKEIDPIFIEELERCGSAV